MLKHYWGGLELVRKWVFEMMLLYLYVVKCTILHLFQTCSMIQSDLLLLNNSILEVFGRRNFHSMVNAVHMANFIHGLDKFTVDQKAFDEMTRKWMRPRIAHPNLLPWLNMQRLQSRQARQDSFTSIKSNTLLKECYTLS
jgi:hypothetical protein